MDRRHPRGTGRLSRLLRTQADIDRLAGAATGSPHDWTDAPLGAFERTTFDDLADVRHHRPVTILDVRRIGEYSQRHIEGALSIPLHELLGRLDDVPAGEVWVHCAGGYRASIAASVLAARDVPVVATDDDFDDHATSSGLPITIP